MSTHPFLNTLQAYYAAIPSQMRLQRQQEAWNKFLQLGLPTRHDETFRYVHLADVWQEKKSLDSLSDAHIQNALNTEPTTGARLVFVDGLYRPELSTRTTLPKNIVVSDLKTGFLQYGPFLDMQWNTLLRDEIDPFALLNAACTQNGLFLYIPPNTVLEEPIELLHLTTGQQALSFPRVQAVFGKHSNVTLICRALSLQYGSVCTVSSCLDALVEEQAHVHYIEPPLTESDKHAQRFDALRVRLKRGSTFKAFTAVTNGTLTRKSWHAGLFGEGAEVFLEGAVSLANEAQAHISIAIEHEAPHCRSNQLFKSALHDASRMSFGGNILVRRRAQKTEAYQLSQSLLLGPRAHMDATPRLEIFADDVKASHGATIGQLDEEQLLYCLTRGIPENQARKLLLAGFFEELTSHIAFTPLKHEIQHAIEKVL